jgi:hypothetical protein
MASKEYRSLNSLATRESSFPATNRAGAIRVAPAPTTTILGQERPLMAHQNGTEFSLSPQGVFVILHGSGLFLTRDGFFTAQIRRNIFFKPEELLSHLQVAHRQGIHVYAVNVTPKLNNRLSR